MFGLVVVDFVICVLCFGLIDTTFYWFAYWVREFGCGFTGDLVGLLICGGGLSCLVSVCVCFFLRCWWMLFPCAVIYID